MHILFPFIIIITFPTFALQESKEESPLQPGLPIQQAVGRRETIIDLTDPIEDLFERSMVFYFKETHEDISKRISPIVSRSLKKQKLKAKMTFNSDAQLAHEMSPFIIDSLDQEISRQNTTIEQMNLENKKSQRKLYIAILSGAASLLGFIGTVVAHAESCK